MSVVLKLGCLRQEEKETRPTWDNSDIVKRPSKNYMFSKFSFYICPLDVFEDFISPTTAAQTLLFTACSKRKEVSNHVDNICIIILNFFKYSFLNVIHVL